MAKSEWLYTKLGEDIWNNKYRYNNESLDEWLERVSGGDKELKQLIIDKKFLFGGRTLSNYNTGVQGASTSNCYSSGYAPDSLNGWMNIAKNLALTYKSQGGQGVSLSKIRPKGSPIGDGRYTTDGIVPFMEILNSVTQGVSQGNSRKGALMMSLDAWHKEADTFIKIKSEEGQIQGANLSLEFDDEFMECIKEYYKNGTIKTITRKFVYDTGSIEYEVTPIKIYKEFCKKAYDWAEPGAIYTNRFRNYNLMQYVKGYDIVTGNPCLHPDTLVHTTEGEIKIKDMKKPMKVYCMDENGKLTIGQSSPSFITKKSARVLEVTVGGRILKLTDNHKVYVKDKGWIEAEDLCIGDTLIRVDGKELKSDKQSTVHRIDLGEITDVYDITVDKHHNFVAEGVIVHNCGEQPLPKNGACNLGSINLSEFVLNPYTKEARFDFKSFEKAVEIAIRGLDKVIDYGYKHHALEEQKDMAYNYRNIGLGIMGLGSMFFKLGIRYGSENSIKLADDIMRNMFINAVIASNKLARELGTFPKYSDKVFDSEIMKNHFSQSEINALKKYGLRNCSLLSVAPSGSIATMLNITTGVEPAFRISYKRTTKSLHKNTDVSYDVYIKEAQEYKNTHKVQKLPLYFISSENVGYKDRINIQATIQNHVDTAISSTVNLPNSATIQEVENLYILAWEKGLKGVTIYRDGCKREGILKDKSSNNSEETVGNGLKRGDWKQKSNDTIYYNRKINIGCGKLKLMIGWSDKEKAIQDMYVIRSGSGGYILATLM